MFNGIYNTICKNYDKKLTFGNTSNEKEFGWKVVSYEEFIGNKLELIDLLTKIRNGEIKFGDKFMFDNKVQVEYINGYEGPILAYKEDGKWKDIFEEYNLNALRDKVEPITKELLDKEEKEYLEYVIRPFKDRIEYITKSIAGEDTEYIEIVFKDDVSMEFPYFKARTMYKSMKRDIYYSLEELGL